MTEDEFIFWYINKIYIFTGVKFKKKFLKDEISIRALINDVIYSLSISTKNKYKVDNMLSNWYNQEQKKAKEDILDFIRFKYKVTLGPRSWVISKMNNTMVKEKDIANELKGRYDEEFTKNIISQWFEDEMVRITSESTLHFK